MTPSGASEMPRRAGCRIRRQRRCAASAETTPAPAGRAADVDAQAVDVHHAVIIGDRSPAEDAQARSASAGWFASWIALCLWDDEAWTVLSTRQLELVRETAALTALPFVLTNRSSVL